MFLLGAGYPKLGTDTGWRGGRSACSQLAPEKAGHGGLESPCDWGGGEAATLMTHPPAAPWTCSCASASRPHS